MRIFFVTAFCFLICLNPGIANSSYDGIFRTSETPSTNLKPFFKWTGVLDNFKKAHASEGNCVPSSKNKCYKKEWLDFLDSIKGMSSREQLNAVQKKMNEAEYILDIINWGVQDYWATPYQFFIKDGDCEDYAIAKYMSLKLLGFPSDKMRIVVLQDNNLGIMHAVLAVYLNDETMVLDNQISQVISSEKIHHYSPIYSINENGWWRHRKN